MKRIEEFSIKFGLALPKEYKDFLIRNNGGRPRPSEFPIHDMPLNPYGSLQVFFGFDAEIPTEDIQENLAEIASDLPHGILPIGNTDGDDYVCLDTRNGSERVVFWDRRNFWGGGGWSESDVYPVAGSFQQLLALMEGEV